MESTTFDPSTVTFPTFLYHAEHAREGKLFTSADDLPTDLTGWHDTPQKFDPAYEAPPQSSVADGTVPEDARRAGFVPQPYPSVRYNRETLAEKTVCSAEEDDALDAATWKHSPDPKTWDEEPTGTAAATVAPGASDTTSRVGASSMTAPTEDEQRAALYKATVSHVVERVSAISDRTVLNTIARFEAENPKGERVTVCKAVKARLAELDAPDAVT